VSKAGQRGSGAAGQTTRQGNRDRTENAGARGAPFAHPADRPDNPLQTEPVEFVGSFPDPQIRLDPPLPEVAFVGRSNVGKSSLLNALVGRPGMARVSGSPGKTRLLNFYRLPELYLVDLPGYGFARASKRDRAGYRELITRYLRDRRSLAGIVWLLDSRHDPSKEDREIQGLLAQSNRPVLAVLTKADKLTRSAQHDRERALATTLGLARDHIQLTSSRSGLGIPELAMSIVTAVRKEDS
jgi:GTP-binding protein